MIHEHKEFSGVNFLKEPMDGDFESCTFTDSNFQGADLSHINFSECRFVNCNFSSVIVSQTAFRGVSFINCKVVGVRFDYCNSFILSLSFDGCQLNLSSFHGLEMRKTVFKECRLQEVDFSETDLQSSVFTSCDFAGATFDNTKLEKSDLSSSYNFSIDPEKNKIKGAKFSQFNLVGLLDKYEIEVE
jgi:uncharacterized protein YjbI with pentapeptide repeats